MQFAPVDYAVIANAELHAIFFQSKWETNETYHLGGILLVTGICLKFRELFPKSQMQRY